MQRKIFENLVLPLGWMLLHIAIEIFVLYRGGNPPTVIGYLTYVLELVTFYSNLVWVAPLLLIKRKPLRFVSSLIVLIAANHLARCWLAVNHASVGSFWQLLLSGDRLVLTIWRLEYALGFSFFIVVLKALERRRVEKEKIRFELLHVNEERARIENTMVQLQLNPHTLHNGLSYLEAQSRKLAPQMTEAIVLLSSVLEPALINAQRVDKVPISNSLSQIENMIALQRLIHGDRQSLRVTTELEVGDDKLLLPPSLLMPVIENVLKYGKLNDPKAPATIDIKIDKGFLYLNTWNQKKKRTSPGNGIGLTSVKHILNYYYFGQHSFDVRENDEEYAVSLTIQL